MNDNINLIGINGRINHGKDTVAQIIQYLVDYTNNQYQHPISETDFKSYIKNGHHLSSKWENKKFGFKLKQIASILLGVPVEKFEDREFKESILPEQWSNYSFLASNGESYKQGGYYDIKKYNVRGYTQTPMTVRTFLQKLGTDAIRNGLHPNTWVNALFADYVESPPLYKEPKVWNLPILLDTTVTNTQTKTDFLCDCGNTFITTIWRVETGHTKSCGCFQKQKVSESNKTHGDSGNRLLSIFKNMKTRCNNPNSKAYKEYGAKGITVCAEWNNYANFKTWALTNGYTESLSLDRKNNSQGYNSTNCRWVKLEDQSLNKEIYKNNKLGIRGVSLKKGNNKYIAQIQYRGKKLILGTFDTPEEASRIYEAKRTKLFQVEEIPKTPNIKWIITDLRFKEEANAIKEKGGILVKRVNKSVPLPTHEHFSERALDNHTFDYILESSGTIDDLIMEVKIMLETYKII